MSQPPEPPEFEPENPARPGEGRPAYGEPAYWQAPPISSTGPMLSSEPSPVLVGYPGPATQRRWTIAIRIILAMPHFFVLWILSIALEVVVFISWFAALFSGRLPAWAHSFISGVVRWLARAYAYVFLLTDVYPPFSLDDDPAYPVRLLTRPTRLNRLAVLFRLILLVPAALVSGVAGYGLLVLSIIGWLSALVIGKLPDPIHQAVAAVNRYAARYAGYVYMVTGEYPWGLFGDQPAPSPDFAAPAAAEPATGGPPMGALAESAAQVGTPADPWRLILSGPAKGTLTACLVVGVGIWAASVTAESLIAKTSVSNTVSLVQVEQANNVVGTTLSSFPAKVSACGQQLTCVTQLDRGAGHALEAFANSVRAAGVSGSAAADASTLASDATNAGHALLQLGSATSVGQYQSVVSSSNLQQDLQQVGADYLKLIRELGAR
jgi:hypothetical protein